MKLYIVTSHKNRLNEAIQIDGTMYRRRKVLNIGGAKVQNIGLEGGANFLLVVN